MKDILMVDDDTALQRAVKTSLEKDGWSVRTADSAEDGLAELRKSRPTLMLLDIRLPGMTGFDLCRKLRADKEFAGLPVIFLTSKAEEANKVLGLELGGDDYLVKPFSALELGARIRAVLRRMRPVESAGEVLTAGTLTLNTGERSVILDGKAVEMTPKEFDLLYLFLSKKRRALSRAYIMESVWKRDHLDTSRTIDTHIKHLRQRLGPLRDCLQTVAGMGYRWVDPGDPS
jgi:DNA-binding response OmpR family regulator